MAGGGTTCASCVKFPLERAALMQNHRAECPEFQTMRRWDYPACPLYREDREYRNRRRELATAIKESERETMKKFDTQAGDIWLTAMKNRVRVVDRSIPEVIQAEYVDGPVNGMNIINFDASTGCSIHSGDCLVERVEP